MKNIITMKNMLFSLFIFVLFSVFCVGSFALYLKIKYRNTYVLRISNGLGEQLYAYSFGYFLHKETGFKIKYNTEAFEEEEKLNNKRSWVFLNITKFVDIDIWEANPLERWAVKKFMSYCSVRQCGRFANFDYDENIAKNKDDFVYFENLFKNYKYHAKYAKDIQNQFSELLDKYADELDEKNKSLIQEMKSHKNSVVMNIRLGDYLHIPKLNVCNFDYYQKAMEAFKNMEDVHYYIFSDDIDGAKKYFKIDKPHTFVNINPLEKPYLNLILSSSAKHNIASNSTFAIWAGILNKNKDKIVVCPSEYFNKYGKKGNEFIDYEISKTIYPEEWVKIDTSTDKRLSNEQIKTDLADKVKDNKIVKIIGDL